MQVVAENPLRLMRDIGQGGFQRLIQRGYRRLPPQRRVSEIVWLPIRRAAHLGGPFQQNGDVSRQTARLIPQAPDFSRETSEILIETTGALDHLDGLLPRLLPGLPVASSRVEI